MENEPSSEGQIPSNDKTEKHANMGEKAMDGSSVSVTEKLGTSTRDEKANSYVYRDFSHVTPDRKKQLEPWGPDQHLAQKLPVKLYSILDNPDLSSIIKWMPHGRSWKIVDRKTFAEEVLPCYFDHSNLESFFRLVNAWGFRRYPTGADRGSYYHELFLRGMPHLHSRMKRLTKDQMKKPIEQEDRSPNFYSMPLPESKMTTTNDASGGGMNVSFGSDTGTDQSKSVDAEASVNFVEPKSTEDRSRSVPSQNQGLVTKPKHISHLENSSGRESSVSSLAQSDNDHTPQIEQAVGAALSGYSVEDLGRICNGSNLQNQNSTNVFFQTGPGQTASNINQGINVPTSSVANSSPNMIAGSCGSVNSIGIESRLQALLEAERLYAQQGAHSIVARQHQNQNVNWQTSPTQLFSVTPNPAYRAQFNQTTDRSMLPLLFQPNNTAHLNLPQSNQNALLQINSILAGNQPPQHLNIGGMSAPTQPPLNNLPSHQPNHAAPGVPEAAQCILNALGSSLQNPAQRARPQFNSNGHTTNLLHVLQNQAQRPGSYQQDLIASALQLAANQQGMLKLVSDQQSRNNSITSSSPNQKGEESRNMDRQR